MYCFDVLRYDASRDDRPRFQTYELEAEARMSVLEALLKIQDEQDPSLAFRYACRGAVCGSCAMSTGGPSITKARLKISLNVASPSSCALQRKLPRPPAKRKVRFSRT